MHRNMRRPPVRISRTSHLYRIRFLDPALSAADAIPPLVREDRLFPTGDDAHTWGEFEAVKRGMELFDWYRLAERGE